MKILLFGGTTEGREIAAGGLPVIYSVTTDYGAELARFPNAEPRVSRMDQGEMEDFIRSRPIAGVIDATHPYAAEVTKNIRAACGNLSVPYVRVTRGAWAAEGVLTAPGYEAAADILAGLLSDTEGGALLTVGSKELEKFSGLPPHAQKRLYVRVLPSSSIIAFCEELGFDPGHIIAMRGPFSKAMNRATLEMTHAAVLVTKDGGDAGGLAEKLEAARELGVKTLLIRRPEDEKGLTAAEALDWGFRLLGLARPENLPSFPLFPLFTDIAGRRAVVIGGGKVAARRVKTLLACGAQVTVVSPAFAQDFDGPDLAAAERLTRPYEKGDLRGAAVAVAASNDRGVNRTAGAEARDTGVPVSVADAPEECTFFFPSLVAEGEIAAAVSTGGRSPALCRRLAARLRSAWPGWIEEEKRGKP